MSEPTTTAPTSTRGVFGRLYHGETNLQIVPRWKLWFAISGVLIAIGIVSLATQGLNLGIDFTGGTVWQIPAGKAKVADVQKAMADLGYKDYKVQLVTQNTSKGTVNLLRVEAEATAKPAAKTTVALDKASSSLEDLRGKVPADARGSIDGVRDQLDGIEGPFATAVPAELKDLQAQIDALPATLKKAKNDVTATRTAASAMRDNVDELSRLEQAERESRGREVSTRLAELTGSKVQLVTVDTVGPSWGKQISEKARNALVVFLLAILLYITLRFEFKMAVATVAALLHDLLIVIGVYSVFQFAVTPATVIAVLTILGFSIYDGIVVFDRVDENTRLLGKKLRVTYSEMANQSMNQVLMRSLNTSITALIPIVSVLVIGSLALGATTLQEFGLALFIGLLSGAYSSIFIATPMLALLKEREPRYRDLRARLAEQAESAKASATTPTEGDTLAAAASSASASGATAAPFGSAPRPRKQGKKR